MDAVAPPLELYWNEKPFGVLVAPDGATGRAWYRVAARSVVIDWSHPDDATLHQEFGTDFWPTCVIELDRRGMRLVVAGKRSNGNTVIQTWSLEAPRIVVPRTGSLGTLEPARIHAVESLYDARVSGQDMVCHMTRNLGRPGGILLQFWDSRVVCDLDTTRATLLLTRVVSPSPIAGALTESRVARTYTDLYGARHINRGHLYVFNNAYDGTIDPLVLVDANRDGRVDSTLRVSGSQWFDEGFSDAANYEH